jgi:peptide-methionine (S)-S-oxide reductase
MQKLFCTLILGGVIQFVAHAQVTNTANTNKTETATFGGGCFWCMEAVFERLPGVRSVTSGFAGGRTENPTYREVCSGETGHAEVTQIEFDPAKISYTKLVEVFWQAHDPTSLNRQGADEGTQYRSVILYHDAKQKLLAEKAKLAAQTDFRKPIVTEIAAFKKFYRADEHHQGYYDAHTDEGYSRAIIAPKLEKLEHKKVIEKEPQTGK